MTRKLIELTTRLSHSNISLEDFTLIKSFYDDSKNMTKEVLRVEAEKSFKENGIKDHDWGNFYVGYLKGCESSKNLK